MELFFLYMYPLVSAISIVGYVPQIRRLLASEGRPEGISLSSWYIWTVSAVLTFGYGFFHLHDFMFCLTAGINLALVAATTLIIALRVHMPPPARLPGDAALVRVESKSSLIEPRGR